MRYLLDILESEVFDTRNVELCSKLYVLAIVRVLATPKERKTIESCDFKYKLLVDVSTSRAIQQFLYIMQHNVFTFINCTNKGCSALESSVHSAISGQGSELPFHLLR
jgi:hypothetical protein